MIFAAGIAVTLAYCLLSAVVRHMGKDAVADDCMKKREKEFRKTDTCSMGLDEIEEWMGCPPVDVMSGGQVDSRNRLELAERERMKREIRQTWEKPGEDFPAASKEEAARHREEAAALNAIGLPWTVSPGAAAEETDDADPDFEDADWNDLASGNGGLGTVGSGGIGSGLWSVVNSTS